MRYTQKMIGHDVVIELRRDRQDPHSQHIAVRGTIEHIKRGIATVRYQVPWHPLKGAYVTYLDGSETWVSVPF